MVYLVFISVRPRRVMMPVLLLVACHIVESGGAALPHQANVRTSIFPLSLSVES